MLPEGESKTQKMVCKPDIAAMLLAKNEGSGHDEHDESVTNHGFELFVCKRKADNKSGQNGGFHV